MGYPHLHQAVYSITESVLEQLEIDDIEKFKKFYNGYGSFDLPNFVNFDTKIFCKKYFKRKKSIQGFNISHWSFTSIYVDR